jgi:hypothetical protein
MEGWPSKHEALSINPGVLQKRTEGVVQAVERLFCKFQALNSNSCHHHNKKFLSLKQRIVPKWKWTDEGKARGLTACHKRIVEVMLRYN